MTTILWQRIEGAGVAIAALLLAVIFGAGLGGWPWWVWPIALLAADLSMLGYALGPRIGAAIYNAAHLYATGLAMVLIGLAPGVQAVWLVPLGLCWLAHVGIDRALGYGLKDISGFHDTHLGRIGHDKNG